MITTDTNIFCFLLYKKLLFNLFQTYITFLHIRILANNGVISHPFPLPLCRPVCIVFHSDDVKDYISPAFGASWMVTSRFIHQLGAYLSSVLHGAILYKGRLQATLSLQSAISSVPSSLVFRITCLMYNLCSTELHIFPMFCSQSIIQLTESLVYRSIHNSLHLQVLVQCFPLHMFWLQI